MLRLFVQIGDALDAAHVLGLVHRDVKPGNILVTSVAEHSGHAHPDHVYLTDFGLTKRTSSLSGSLTGTGHFLGTVDYVSPEQIQGAPVGPEHRHLRAGVRAVRVPHRPAAVQPRR